MNVTDYDEHMNVTDYDEHMNVTDYDEHMNLLQSKKNPDGPSLVQPDFKKKGDLSVKENILQRPGKEPVFKKAALLQSKKNPDGPSLVQPDFKKKGNLSVKENILQRPGKEPVLKKAAVKSSQDDTIPKPLILPNIQPPPGVKNSKPNDFMQGKGDSYKDMANQLGLSKNEADEIVPGEIDGREDGPEGGKMKAYLNEGRPDGDQLRDLLPEIDRENKVSKY
ncbi:hypothetical protein QYM36_008306 [Artemia franciscana]|uniref:Uncharacterized protein n=1 Tax=Artemia franciscana TaxID=6661 RepID=A0AA88LME1_ARTSF|nr:hypothetical protein QYM36_008306 [Artemia franciscana]